MNHQKIHISQVRKYFDLEQYQEAIANLEIYLDEAPENHYLSCYLGLAYFLKGNELEAQEIWFNTLLEADNIIEELIKILVTEGKNKLEKRQFSLAEKLYQEVIELEPDNWEYYFYLGDILAQKGELEKAIDYYQESLKINSNSLKTYEKQGELMEKLGEYSQAIINYQKILEMNPNNYDILYRLGLCYSQINQLDKSLDCWQNCLKINEESPPSLLNYKIYGDMGYILLQKGAIEEAIYYWQKLVKFNVKLVHDYCNWINKFINSNDINNFKIISNGTLLQSLDFSKNLAEIYFNLGYFLMIRNSHNLAIKCYQKSLEYDDQNVDTYYNLIVSLIIVNQIDEAELYLPKLTALNSEKSQHLTNLIEQTKNNIQQTQLQSLSSPTNLIDAPNSFYNTALEWAINNKLETTNYYPLYPENTITLNPPNTPDKYIHYSFRLPKQFTLPKSFVVEIPEGSFYLNKDEFSSLIITSENQFIGDLSPESPALTPNHPDSHPSKHSILNRSFLPPFEYIDGNVAVLSGLLNNIYFHWLFDILPRIDLLKQSKIELENIDYFLINNNASFQQETLNILGIPQHKIISKNEEIHIKAKNLIVPSFPGTIAWMPQWVCKFLKDSFLDSKYLTETQKKRIYIKRNQSSNRRLINEEEIIEFLEKFGFESVNLESLSVKEQAVLLSKSEIIISPHGSGLSNLVFCQKGTKIIEIFSPFYVYPCYWLISNLIGLEYYYVIGEIFGSWHFHKLLYSDSRSEDIYLDCQALLKFLKFAQIFK